MKNVKITIETKTIVEDAAIAVHSAVISGEEADVSFFTRQIDKEACKQHRAADRAARAGLEDFAYKIQDQLKNGDL